MVRYTEEEMREKRRQIRERELADKSVRDRQKVQLIYILYLANVFLGISVLFGLVMAYNERGNTEEWLETHHVWLIRTFWIGLLYFTLSLLLTVAIIGMILFLMTLVWFVIRMVSGLQALNANRPIDNPHSWMF